MKHAEEMRSLALRWGKGWEEQEAVWRWPEVVGEALRKLVRPLHVEGGMLHIAVRSPVVANELRLWEEELLARLAQAAPASQVRALRFHITAEIREPPTLPVKPSAAERTRAEAAIPETLPVPLRAKLVGVLAQALAQEAAILARGGKRCARCGVAFLGDGPECPLCGLRP